MFAFCTCFMLATCWPRKKTTTIYRCFASLPFGRFLLSPVCHQMSPGWVFVTMAFSYTFLPSGVIRSTFNLQLWHGLLDPGELMEVYLFQGRKIWSSAVQWVVRSSACENSGRCTCAFDVWILNGCSPTARFPTISSELRDLRRWQAAPAFIRLLRFLRCCAPRLRFCVIAKPWVMCKRHGR